jgi:DNA-binding beta-propeller fold protein YncE
LSEDGTSVYVASGEAVAVFQRDTTTGELAQLVGTAGCLSQVGAGLCTKGKALASPNSVAVSADGKSVYIASLLSDAVAVFRRNPTSGALTQLAGTAGCVSETGSGGTCADGRGLDGARSVVVSADSKSVYVTSLNSNAVTVFERDATTGQLTQPAGTAGCVSETGSGGECADGRALSSPTSLAVGADGKSVYVASFVSDAVTLFQRDTTTGQLAQPAGTAGCVSESGSDSCARGSALDGARSVAVSADGRSVYVASDFPSDAVAAFQRDATTGRLTQLAGTAGCVSETGSSGECVNGRHLDGPFSLAVSEDGSSVYVPSVDSDAVAIFAREN